MSQLQHPVIQSPYASFHNPRYVVDLYDAGIITSKTRDIHLERIRLYQEYIRQMKHKQTPEEKKTTDNNSSVSASQVNVI